MRFQAVPHAKNSPLSMLGGLSPGRRFWRGQTEKAWLVNNLMKARNGICVPPQPVAKLAHPVHVTCVGLRLRVGYPVHVTCVGLRLRVAYPVHVTCVGLRLRVAYPVHVTCVGLRLRVAYPVHVTCVGLRLRVVYPVYVTCETGASCRC